MTKPIPKDLRAGAKSNRELSIEMRADSVDADQRTIELAFSSETPVDRWFGREILDHNPKSIRLDRMKRGGALLVDHDTRDQVGVLQSVRIDADRVGRAVMRFGKSARAQEIFQDVIDEIRTNVSVAYRVHAAVLESTDDGVETYRITDWEPYEISLVSVPADVAVGVGRSEEAESPLPTTEPDSPTQEVRAMPAENTHAPDNSAAITAAANAASGVERQRAESILAIGEQYGDKFPNVRKLAIDAARTGMGVEEFRAKAIDAMANAPTTTAEIGMDKKDTTRYSIMRALHYLANPGDKRAREAAAFEIECSEAAAKRNGKASQGLMVPYDVLKRDLTVGTATAGGHTVATDLLSGDFIELLRNAIMLPGMGARVLTGLVGNIAIPRQTGAATAYWVAESGAPTESQQAFNQLTMSPKTVGAYTDISRKLLLQSSIDVESFVQGDLARVLGLAIQAAAIQGGGSNEPTGILGTAGIGSVAGGTNGLAPTWAHIIELETDVSVANADIGSLAYLTNAKVRGKLKGTEKFSGTNGNPVWADGNTPLNGYAAAVTNAVPSNLTKGSSANVCSAIIFGNFADLVIGMWGGLDLTVDPYSNSTSGTVRVVALQDVDVAVRHAESFSAMLDALTA